MARNTSMATSLQSVPISAFSKKFRPLRNLVALKRARKDVMAPGSSLLYRPESKLKNSDRAEVLAVGPSCRLGLKKGDTVIVTRFADGDRDVGGERLMILPETEIMAVEEE
jgi:co-chaperonin GroES (HSP10)